MDDFHRRYGYTRLSLEVFSLESPWTLDYVLCFGPLPPLGIELISVAVRGGVLGKPMY